jgi:hypothetical protein
MDGIIKYSKGHWNSGEGIPAKIQKNDGPKLRQAFIPTLQVKFPGIKVLT